jgi:hypothetical protein
VADNDHRKLDPAQHVDGWVFGGSCLVESVRNMYEVCPTRDAAIALATSRAGEMMRMSAPSSVRYDLTADRWVPIELTPEELAKAREIRFKTGFLRWREDTPGNPFSAESGMDNLYEMLNDEYSEGVADNVIGDISTAMEEELDRELEAVWDRWVAKHKLSFVSFTVDDEQEHTISVPA